MARAIAARGCPTGLAWFPPRSLPPGAWHWLKPILDLDPTYRLEILVRSEQYQLVLSSHSSYQEIELGQHTPCGAKLLKNFSKFSSCLLVGGPEAQKRQSCLQTGQVLPIAPAQAYAASVLAEHRQANAKTMARTEPRVDPLFQRWLPVQVRR